MIALIPARSGSKGLPMKNIKMLNGHPLIKYTIDAAQASHSIKHTFVSTDSEEIADIAVKCGASVPFLRSPDLATDSAKAIDVYLDFINRIELVEKIKLEELVILLPTCPLRDSADIDKAVKLYREKKADSIISFTHEDHPVYWHAWYRADSKIEFIFDHQNSNRQDLRQSIYPNGAIYIIKKHLLEKGTYYGDQSFTYLMEREKSVDIDDEFDFELAEFLLKKRK